MSRSIDLAALPEAVREQLKTCYLRVKAEISAWHLWERVLTPGQRERLGGDVKAAFAAGGTVEMWRRLHGVTPVRALLDAARALNWLDEPNHRWLLRETGEAVEDPEDIRACVVPTTDLVLIERPRQAFWCGTEIELDWTRRDADWNYLWELCRAAKRGVPLDRTAFSDEYAPDYLTKTKSRLSRSPAFPVRLTERIHSAGSRSQSLDVPRDQIRLFQVEEVPVLREWCGAS